MSLNHGSVAGVRLQLPTRSRAGMASMSHGPRRPADRLLVFPDLRLFAQHRVQQRTVDLDLAVVVDVSLLPELVHEEADARSGGADHLGQRFLTEVDRDRLRAA